MSQYRQQLRRGILWWYKRKLLPRLTGWRWMPNRSEEEYLTRMINSLVAINKERTTLMKRIPVEQERIDKIKEGLANASNGVSSIERDRWRPPMDPARLLEAIKLGKKKADRPAKPGPVILANVTTPAKS